MKRPVRISVVSFLNTLPFRFGIEKSGFLDHYQLEIVAEPPSVCAKRLANGEADLGLVPVAAIPSIKNATLLPGFCLGTKGKVRTVVLLSNCDVREVDSVVLDEQSVSSNTLIRILFRDYWKTNPVFTTKKNDYNPDKQGVVAIGDKVFGLEKSSPFLYDLGQIWLQHTSKPFVFASWVHTKELPSAFLDDFNKALAWGVTHIQSTPYDQFNIDPKTAFEYLTSNMYYFLDEDMVDGLNTFLTKAKPFLINNDVEKNV